MGSSKVSSMGSTMESCMESIKGSNIDRSATTQNIECQFKIIFVWTKNTISSIPLALLFQNQFLHNKFFFIPARLLDVPLISGENNLPHINAM